MTATQVDALPTPPSHAPPDGARSSWWPRVLLALIVVVSIGSTVAASTRTSTTFDEITAPSAGVRGFALGDFSMMPNFPPVMQYLYGLPVYLSGVNLPAETPGVVPHRYWYAQQFFWEAGNDPERIAFLARLVAAASALVLILLTYGFTVRHYGRVAGMLAAALVAFLPDVLAHGGVSYNDIALAPAFLAGLWTLDRAVRTPTLARGAAAGALVSLAIGIKHSALVLGPIAVLLVALDLVARTQDRREHARRLGLAVAAAFVTGYLLQVLLYRGDFTLSYLAESTVGAAGHIAGGHGVPAYLFGETSADAWWYFYPVAFLFKTPVALHILMVLALLGATYATAGASWRDLARSHTRVLWIALLIFGAVLVRSNLVIGFRYALPLLPIICILTAVGCASVWARGQMLLRVAMVMLVVWAADSALSYYPHFLAYTSEYQPDADRGYEVFVDSSLDWGQGLLELRDFMRAEGIDRIYLSYFGSALPHGYGIDYVPLPSYFPLQLPDPATVTEQPRFAAVSATNLTGLYFNGDPFADLRTTEPYAVLGHTMFIFRVAE